MEQDRKFDPRDPALYKYVDVNHLFMREAYKEACKSGCGSRQVGAVIVKAGQIIARGHNSGGRESEPCPRVLQNLPSGAGYELCPHCDNMDLQSHAEANVINNAMNTKADTSGSELYLFGHWWACEPCLEKMRTAGIIKIYLVKGAAEMFQKRGVLTSKKWYQHYKNETTANQPFHL